MEESLMPKSFKELFRLWDAVTTKLDKLTALLLIVLSVGFFSAIFTEQSGESFTKFMISCLLVGLNLSTGFLIALIREEALVSNPERVKQLLRS